MIDEIEKVPLLQISLPVNFDKWDGSEPILVAYDPVTIDDDECKQIVAFDMEGKEYILDAKNDPDFPVIVAGINERVNNNDKKISQLNKSTLSQHEIQIVHFRLMDDHEPWYKGNAEIYVKTKKIYSGDDWAYIYFDGVNKEKTYYDYNYSWLPKTIYATSSQNIVEILLEIWEQDFGGEDNDDLVEKKYYIYNPGALERNPDTATHNTWFRGDANDADVYINTIH